MWALVALLAVSSRKTKGCGESCGDLTTATGTQIWHVELNDASEPAIVCTANKNLTAQMSGLLQVKTGPSSRRRPWAKLD